VGGCVSKWKDYGWVYIHRPGTLPGQKAYYTRVSTSASFQLVVTVVQASYGGEVKWPHVLALVLKF